MTILHKDIFVVIVSYNGEQWLLKNLKSLKQSQYPIKVIVIDNNSSDSSVNIIKSFSSVQLILSKENLGFGKANNIAIRAALKQGADYVFLLNQDTWLYPKTIKNLIRVAQANENYGIISPLHFSKDKNVLDKNFETYWNKKTKSISKCVDEVPFVNAAAWLISKHVIEKVGYFEPLFNHYGEDRNYTNRVAFHHYKSVVVKDAKICHDRKMYRDFNKDKTQSKYMILTDILNVNYTIIGAYLKGFRSVFGLPKYFYRHYTLAQILQMFFMLIIFYGRLVIKVFSIFKKREGYKK